MTSALVVPDVPAFEELVDPGAELTRLGEGYQFTEGPAWSPREQCLYFSDIPSDDRWRWSAARGMELDGHPTFKANGLVLDRDGTLVACEQVSSCVVRIRPGCARELVAFHHGGRYLNSPNDIVVRGADGSIYFTDPDYGRWNDWIGQERSRELGFRGVYRIPPQPDGEARLRRGGGRVRPAQRPVLLAGRARALRQRLRPRPHQGLRRRRRRLAGPGAQSSPTASAGASRPTTRMRSARPRHQELHDAGAVDGMKCDERGNVWVTGPGGVWVFDAAGERLGRLRAPEVVGNLTWGGEGLRTLFLMTSTTVHSLPTRVAGARLAHHD